MTYSAAVEIGVTEHAMWRAAERFPGFDTLLIEDEVRDALAQAQVVTDRRRLGLTAGSDPSGLYVEGGGGRVYALRTTERVIVVTTTMRTVLESE